MMELQTWAPGTPEALAEVVYSRLLGVSDDSAFDRFTAALGALVADGEANDGIAASVAAGDGLWAAVPGDGGDAISSGAWRDMMLSARSSHV